MNRTISDMIYDVPRLYHLLLEANWNVSMPMEAFREYDDGKLALKGLAYRQKALFQDSHETIIYCRFNSGPCLYANFTHYKDEERFLCLSITPANRTIVESGEGKGLYLLLYHHAKAFLTEEQQIESISGFKVALHEPGTKPDFSGAFNAPLAYKTSAGLETVIERKISRPNQPCEDQLPNVTYTWDYSRPGDFENVTFFGTLQDCVIRAKQKEFARECGCLASHLAMPADMMARWPPCHQLPEEFFFRDIFVNTNSFALYYTIMNATGQFGPLADYILANWDTFNKTRSYLACYRRVRLRQNTQGVPTDSCELPCSLRRNRLNLVLATWPSANSIADHNLAVMRGYIKRLLLQAAADGRSLVRIRQMQSKLESRIASSFCVVDLFARSTRVQTAVETLAYPMRNLLSDLGGSLGLWIGVSIITLLEIGELGITLCHLTCSQLISGLREISIHQLQPKMSASTSPASKSRSLGSCCSSSREQEYKSWLHRLFGV